MVTIAQLKEWRPEKLSSLADTLNGHRQKLTYLQEDIDDGRPPKSWIGGDAENARTEHQKLASDIYDDVAELTAVIEAIDLAQPEIANAKSMLETALSRAKGNGFEVSADGTVSDPDGQYHSRFEAEQAGEVMRGIADDISTALQKATDADSNLAEELSRANKGDIDATSNLTGMGSIEDMLRGMTPDQQVTYLTEHPEKLKGLAHTLPPEVQQKIADKIAPDFGDGDVDPKTVQVMAALEHESPFTKNLYDKVTPDQLQAVVNHLSDDAYPEGHVSSDADKKAVQEYKDFLTAAGAGFATYTKGTGEYAPPSNLVDTWTNAIENGEPGEGSALTLLLKAGGQNESYDKDFIAPLTDKVYDWERSQDGPVWAPRDRQPGLIDPFLTTDDHMFSNKGGYIYASDGMANLLGAMGHSPDGAQQFFSDDSGGVDQDKMKYLVTERTFSGDHQSDEGNGLGAALAAAGIGKDGHTAWNAEFTNDLFKTIADKSGTGDGHFIGIDYPDDKWHIWPGMNDDLGKLAGSYAHDVYDIVDSGASEGGATNLNISGGDLDKVLGEIGRGDKTGLETLGTALAVEGNERTDAAIHDWEKQHPGVPHTLAAATESNLATTLQGVGDSNGKVLGHVITEGIKVDVDDDKIAATRAEMTSKAIDVASGFIPGGGDVLGKAAGHLATSAFDVTKDQAIDQLKNAVASAPDATSGQYISDSRGLEDSVKFNMVNQLVQNGYVKDVPDSLLVDGPHGKMLNPDLYDANGVDGIGSKGQYTDAQLAQMRKDWNYFTEKSPDHNLIDGVTSQAMDGFDRELNKAGS